MPCERIETPQGTVIACTRGQRRQCAFCKSKATIACDHADASRPSGTCDKPCCKQHAVYAGGRKDYCQTHAKQAGMI